MALPDPPPKDPNGQTIPHNHCQIANEDRFIRRVSKQFLVPTRDGKGRCLSSAALEPSSSEEDKYCGLSGDLEAFIISDGMDPQEFVKGAANLGSIVFLVSAFRTRDFFVGYDPNEENKYHGSVWQNDEQGAKFTRGKRRELLKQATWHVAIAGVKIVDDGA